MVASNPPTPHPPPPLKFFVGRWQTCMFKIFGHNFVNERQRDWVNFTHQRGLPIFSGTMGCWIFSIFTRFNMFLRFYQQLSNQWYWRAPCTWRHSVKILFQKFIYPPILIQIFIVCSLLLCQTSDLNVFSMPFLRISP